MSWNMDEEPYPGPTLQDPFDIKLLNKFGFTLQYPMGSVSPLDYPKIGELYKDKSGLVLGVVVATDRANQSILIQTQGSTA